MSVQTRNPHASSASPAGISRYDVLLFLLPVPLFLGGLAGTLGAVPPALGIGLGGVPSALLLAYGLFVDAPVPSKSEQARI